MKQNFFISQLFFALSLVAILVGGCAQGGSGDFFNDQIFNTVVFRPDMSDMQVKVQTALINARNGQRFLFKAGTYQFNSTISMEGKEDIIIEGEGMNNTILSFAGQVVGAEGLKFTGTNDLVVANLTIENAKGDGIKIKDADGIALINVGAVWTGEPGPNNGAYGLYPVTSTNVLIDGCYVRGASDAGIYVGQTSGCIVRNSKVEYCVAGIEIENTSNADVHSNLCIHNTGGVLVFDLPQLPIKNGTKNRVYNNQIIQNDYKNFAPPGNMVANVPPGTGVLLMSAQEVEIFGNQISDNNVMGVGAIAYLTLVALDPTQAYNDAEYDPYSHGIYIHDNNFSRSTQMPTESNAIGVIVQSLFPGGNIPDILYDGYIYPNSTDADRICIQNNGNAAFANLDVQHDFAGISTDASAYQCAQTPIPAPVVSFPRYPR